MTATRKALPYPATLTTTLDQICSSEKCQFDVASVEPAGSVASRSSLTLSQFEQHVHDHAQNCFIIYNLNMMIQNVAAKAIYTCIHMAGFTLELRG